MERHLLLTQATSLTRQSRAQWLYALLPRICSRALARDGVSTCLANRGAIYALARLEFSSSVGRWSGIERFFRPAPARAPANPCRLAGIARYSSLDLG